MSAFSKTFPKYFTYRARLDYAEDKTYRHLEPASAYQLELSRLTLYDLQRRETQNRKMHLYLGTAKSSVANKSSPKEQKYFVRSIVRHSDLITKDASFDYIRLELVRALVDAMDELDIAMSTGNGGGSCGGGNHVFLNFIAPLLVLPDEIVQLVTQLVPKYSSRLWKLCILQVELKLLVQPSLSPAIPTTFRVHISINRDVQEVNVYTESNVNGKV